MVFVFLDTSDRVHDIEDENRRLKRQLTISQNQLISLIGEQQKNELSGRANDHFEDDYDNGGGEEGHKPPCKHHVRFFINSKYRFFCMYLNNNNIPVVFFFHVQEMGLPKCIELDIAIVCAGYNSSRTVVTLVKSILFYRHHPIHFHFITDEATKNVMETLFETWLLPQVNMLYQYFASCI